MDKAEKRANEYLDWIGEDNLKLAHAKHAIRLAVEDEEKIIVEKACAWFAELENGITITNVEAFAEDFRKYLKNKEY